MILRSRSTFIRLVAALSCAAPLALGAQETAVQGKLAPISAIAGEVSYQSFDGDVDPWTLASVALWKRNSAGTFIARVNYANRYATDGVQVEADAYPRLSDKTYLYFNAGYSGASVFPEWRAGAEAFTALPRAWEASLGVRQLRFNGVPVTMLTGAVGKYAGNYWLSLRPYVRVRDGSATATTTLTVRRYYEDAEHFLGAMLTYGESPTESVTPDAVALNSLFAAAIHGSMPLTTALHATWSLSHNVEELSASSTRRSITVTAGLRRRF